MVVFNEKSPNEPSSGSSVPPILGSKIQPKHERCLKNQRVQRTTVAFRICPTVGWALPIMLAPKGCSELQLNEFVISTTE